MRLSCDRGAIVGVKNFKLVANTKKFKVAPFKYKIMFTEYTRLLTLIQERFPYQWFWFKTFEEIENIVNVEDEALFGMLLF